MKIQDLKRPFPPEQVHWRIGATNKEKTRGLPLAYIDARDVMDRLDEVCGPEKWSDSYHVDGPRVICMLNIKVNDEWISKSDGAGDTQVEAEKGAISDAFKRAAVKWGVGRYLYNIEAPWVSLAGKDIHPDERPKLHALLLQESPEHTAERICDQLMKATSLKQLHGIWTSNWSYTSNLPDHLKEQVESVKDGRKDHLTAEAA